MHTKALIIIMACVILITTAHAQSYTFSDSTSFTTEDYLEGSSKPAAVSSSSINISGTNGIISDLNVTLSGINSTAIIDMTFVLVGPNGTGVVLASHAGGGTGSWTKSPARLKNVNLTFDDSAAGTIEVSTSLNDALKKQVKTGSYQTSAYLEVPEWHQVYTSAIALLNPVASGIFSGVSFSTENLLSAFNDLAANGTWELLAYDNLSDNQTTVSGWSLDFITVSAAVPEPAEWLLLGLCIFGIIILFRTGKTTF